MSNNTVTSGTKLDIKTITEFLAEQPNVDVSRAWERCWGIHSGIVERVKQRFAVSKHPATAGHEYFTSLDQSMEGSFNAWSGPRVEWLVHSWLGNRKASLLDMNATVFLSQQNQVPHLVIIFGTVPKLFFYADYTPRVDLRTRLDYVNKYYEPANASAIRFRGLSNFTWNWSHGTYLRGLMSPVCTSVMGELNEENIAACEGYLKEFVDRWFGWLDEAERAPLPAEQRLAQQQYDHYVREIGYRTDPMNVLAQRAFGPEEFNRRLELRMGLAQMAESRGHIAKD
jgi:Red chlorophyll catabolite reductase (RCC reductase)